MALPDGATRALRRVSGTLLPIAAVAVGGYLVYHAHRLNALVERDQRAIASMGAQIRGRLDAIATVIATNHRNCATSTGPPPTGASGPCDEHHMWHDPAAAAPDVDFEKVMSETIDLPAATPFGTRLRIAEPEKGGYVLVSYEAACDQALPLKPAEAAGCRPDRGKCATTPSPFATCTRIPLEGLVGSLLTDGTIFDATALTIGSVPVVVRTALPTDVREDLQHGIDKLASASSEPARTGAIQAVTDALRFLQPAPAPTVVIRGEEYRLFTEPVQGVATLLNAADGGTADADKKPDRVIRLRALVRVAALADEAREIPNGWVLAILFVLVVAGLSWPLLQIWSMSTRERLSGLDVRLLVVSFVLGTGLFTFAGLQLAGHLALHDDFDAGLGELAGQLEARLTDDVTSAVAILTSDHLDGRQLQYTDFGQVFRVEDPSHPAAWWVPRLEGSTWTLTTKDPPLLSVKNREYYRNFLAGRVWTMAGASKTFSAEVVLSQVDGRATLALMSGTPERRVIGMRVSALADAVVPDGFGFAFVDEAGWVQLHSDKQRNVIENFVRECGSSERVLAAIVDAPTDGTTPPIDTTYRGVSHRLVVHRIPGTLWRLVVFRDRRLLGRVTNEIITSWSALFMLYIGGFVLVLLTVQIVHDGYRAEWLWPDRDQARRYPAAAIRLLATAAVASLALGGQPGLARLGLIAAMASGVVGMLCLALAYLRPTLLAEAERRLARVTVAVALAGTVILLAAACDVTSLLALGALVAAWYEPGAFRPSQAVAVIALFASAALHQVGLSPLWSAGVIAVALPFWVPWSRLPAGYGERRSAMAHALGRLHVGGHPLSERLVTVRTWVSDTEGGFRLGYTSMLVGLLVVVAVAPAATLYQDVSRRVTAELSQYLRADFQHRCAERVARARSAAGTLPVDLPAIAQSMFATSWLDQYGRGADVVDVPGPLTTLAPFLYPAMPAFDPPIPALRVFGTTPPADESCEVSHDLRQAPRLTVPGARRPWKRRVLLGGLWIALTLLGFSVLWSIARLLFLLDADRDEPRDATRPPRGSLIVWTLASTPSPTLFGITTGTQRVVDLRRPVTVETFDNLDALTAVQVDHLECTLDDTTLHGTVLGALERLIRAVTPKIVIVTAEVDPLHWVSGRIAELDADREALTDDAKKQELATKIVEWDALRARWARLLDAFHRERITITLPPTSTPPAAATTAQAVLERTYTALRETPAIDPWEDTCEARHWQIWHQCTRAERLVLRHLAEEGFINPNAKEVTRTLLRRLLIRREHAFCLATEDFRRFALSAETRATITAWERSGSPSAWARLRGPLLTVASLAGAYLLVAEPDAFNWTIALTTGLAAGLPTILNVFKMFGDERGGAGAR